MQINRPPPCSGKPPEMIFDIFDIFLKQVRIQTVKKKSYKSYKVKAAFNIKTHKIVSKLEIDQQDDEKLLLLPFLCRPVLFTPFMNTGYEQNREEILKLKMWFRGIITVYITQHSSFTSLYCVSPKLLLSFSPYFTSLKARTSFILQQCSVLSVACSMRGQTRLVPDSEQLCIA